MAESIMQSAVDVRSSSWLSAQCESKGEAIGESPWTINCFSPASKGATFRKVSRLKLSSTVDENKNEYTLFMDICLRTV